MCNVISLRYNGGCSAAARSAPVFGDEPIFRTMCINIILRARCKFGAIRRPTLGSESARSEPHRRT